MNQDNDRQRIDQKYRQAEVVKTGTETKGEKGMHGETLRPSEREPKYVPTKNKPEGGR